MSGSENGWYETFRSVVFPWHCDHFGHMNVRWYAHHFDDGGFHLWTMSGIPQSEFRARGVAMVVAQIKIDYFHELTQGELLVVRNAWTHIGNKSLRHIGRMYNADTNELCAQQETIEVFFNPETRQSAPMPDYVREALADKVVDPGPAKG